eukprot:3744073-Pleurochrysis_carterae.AAC.2
MADHHRRRADVTQVGHRAQLRRERGDRHVRLRTPPRAHDIALSAAKTHTQRSHPPFPLHLSPGLPLPVCLPLRLCSFEAGVEESRSKMEARPRSERGQLEQGWARLGKAGAAQARRERPTQQGQVKTGVHVNAGTDMDAVEGRRSSLGENGTAVCVCVCVCERELMCQVLG